MEKYYLWGTHFFWLCNTKTTYKIMYYTRPIHILRRWCQELLVCNFSCIHCSHIMTQDVDYFSRINDSLVKAHVSICNRLSLTNRADRPGDYDTSVLESILLRGKYYVKPSDVQVHIHHTSAQMFLHTGKRANITVLPLSCICIQTP